jgi:hypothetical protein
LTRDAGDGHLSRIPCIRPHTTTASVWTTTVYAILRDSQRVPLTRDQLGMDFWAFFYNVVAPIKNANYKSLRPFAGLMCARFEGEIVALEVRDLGVAISRNGPVFGLDPVVLATADIACQREDRGL